MFLKPVGELTTLHFGSHFGGFFGIDISVFVFAHHHNRAFAAVGVALDKIECDFAVFAGVADLAAKLLFEASTGLISPRQGAW